MPDTEHGRRAKRKPRRRPSSSSTAASPRRQLGGSVGGRYQPLNPSDLSVVDQAVRKILQNVGMSEAPETVVEHVTAAGGSVDSDGRLHFSAQLIERALDGLARDFTLCGQQQEHDM